MPTPSPLITTYIASAPPFAQPILRHIRALIHDTCPGVTETIKWRMPHFEYKGILCGIAALSSIVSLDSGNTRSSSALFVTGWASENFPRWDELPSDKVLRGYIKKAMQLNEDGVKVPSKPKPKKPRRSTRPRISRRSQKEQKGPDRL